MAVVSTATVVAVAGLLERVDVAAKVVKITNASPASGDRSRIKSINFSLLVIFESNPGHSLATFFKSTTRSVDRRSRVTAPGTVTASINPTGASISAIVGRLGAAAPVVATAIERSTPLSRRKFTMSSRRRVLFLKSGNRSMASDRRDFTVQSLCTGEDIFFCFFCQKKRVSRFIIFVTTTKIFNFFLFF